MNSIFKNDADLIKLITSKKVYPHLKSELVDIVKKSAIKPLESKENTIIRNEKGEKV
jgi:hypothetical protein